uniref:Uncharacterized protein n=1 Tax=Leersia perrieri TaxID=77586 RepID=A0A0D9XMR6_9ORYZ
MGKQAVSLCKVLMMVLALIFAMHTAPVDGGRAAAAVRDGYVPYPRGYGGYAPVCIGYRCPPAATASGSGSGSP